MTTIAHLPTVAGTPDKIALIDDGRDISYQSLDASIEACARGLLGASEDLGEERVAFFLPAGLDYVSTLFGVWRAGGIAVPLNTGSAIPELEYYLGSAGCKRLIAEEAQHTHLAPLCEQLDIDLLTPSAFHSSSEAELPLIEASRRALMIFTSGTTSKPKGVISTSPIYRPR